jgi:hypothetical protein
MGVLPARVGAQPLAGIELLWWFLAPATRSSLCNQAEHFWAGSDAYGLCKGVQAGAASGEPLVAHPRVSGTCACLARVHFCLDIEAKQALQACPERNRITGIKDAAEAVALSKVRGLEIAPPGTT